MMDAGSKLVYGDYVHIILDHKRRDYRKHGHSETHASPPDNAPNHAQNNTTDLSDVEFS